MEVIDEWDSQVVLVVKNPPANAGDRCRFDPWVGKIPWRRKWQPTPVLLPGEFHGQGNLPGYSPWGCTELDMTEAAEHCSDESLCAKPVLSQPAVEVNASTGIVCRFGLRRWGSTHRQHRCVTTLETLLSSKK